MFESPTDHPARWLLLTLLCYINVAALGLVVFLMQWNRGEFELSSGAVVLVAAYCIITACMLVVALAKVLFRERHAGRWARWSLLFTMPLILAMGAIAAWAFTDDITWAHVLMVIPGYGWLFGTGVYHAVHVATSTKVDDIEWEKTESELEDAVYLEPESAESSVGEEAEVQTHTRG